MAKLDDKHARPEDVKLFRKVSDVAPELWLDAKARPLEQILKGAGLSCDSENNIVVPYMGGDYLLNLEAKTILGPAGQRRPGFQKALVLLSYLAQAQDLGLSGRMVTSREINGGAMFFNGPHALLTAPVIDKFGRDSGAFLKKAASLGFQPDGGAAGTSCRGLVLPHIAVGMILHEADDEFEAELTYTFDSYAHYHLPLGGLWAMINVLAEELAYED